MSKVKEIRVGLGATIPFGDYQNFKPMAEVIIDVDENDDIELVFRNAWRLVGNEINRQRKIINTVLKNKLNTIVED